MGQSGQLNAVERLLGSVSLDDADHGKVVDVRLNSRRSILRDWWLEIAAVALSSIALAVVIGMLHSHQSQPLPEWPYSLTVNTLVSIYAAVFKASMLFAVTAILGQLKWLWYRKDQPLHHLDVYDQASRGPLGSSKFLWFIGHRDILASASSIVIVLMVVLDPFTQQLLRYYDDPRAVPGDASLPRTSFLDDLGYGSVHVGAGTNSVPPVWQNAIIVGLNGGAESIPVTCWTGNCTFHQSYATVGFCSKCTDVSGQLKLINSSYTVTSDQGSHPSWGINTTLPSGFSVFNSGYRDAASYGTGVYTDWTGTHTTDDWTVEIILAKSPFVDADHFRELFKLSDSTCSSSLGNTSWPCRGYGAAACQLYPCVKKFDGSSMVFGTLDEKTVTTSVDERWWGTDVRTAAELGSMIDLSCVKVQERSKLQEAGYQFSTDQTWLRYNTTRLSGGTEDFDALTKTLLSQGCLFMRSAYVELSLWNEFLNSFFNGTVSGFANEDNPQKLDGPQNLQQIFNYGNISFERVSDIFANVSESMTAITRQSGAQNYSNPAVGNVMRVQTCLSVRWPWLAFPATLTIVVWSLLIFMLTTQQGAREVPTWKSSTLPILLNVVLSKAARVSDEPGKSDRIEDREVLARQIKARLVETDEGIELLDSMQAREQDRKGD